MLKCNTRRRSCANTRNTYSVWKRIVGTVKKSTETNVLAVEEGAPSLRRRSALPDHVFGHTGLADGDAQFEQLTMDVGRAPQRVGAAHLPDQIADFAGDRRSTWFAAAHFPGPEQAKALAMPRDDGLRPDDGQGRAPVLPNARQDD